MEAVGGTNCRTSPGEDEPYHPWVPGRSVAPAGHARTCESEGDPDDGGEGTTVEREAMVPALEALPQAGLDLLGASVRPESNYGQQRPVPQRSRVRRVRRAQHVRRVQSRRAHPYGQRMALASALTA